MQGLPQETCIKWCQEHEFTLTHHKRCFIAVCLQRGILASAAGEKEFIKELCRKVPISERHRIFITHTSEFTSDDNMSVKEAHKLRKLASENRNKQEAKPWNKKTQKSIKKLNIAIDFDNVIYPSEEWEGFDLLTKQPTNGAIKFLKMVSKHYKVVIISIRATHPTGLQAMKDFLVVHGMEMSQIEEFKFANTSRARTKIEDLKRWEGKFPSLSELRNI